MKLTKSSYLYRQVLIEEITAKQNSKLLSVNLFLDFFKKN